MLVVALLRFSLIFCAKGVSDNPGRDRGREFITLALALDLTFWNNRLPSFCDESLAMLLPFLSSEDLNEEEEEEEEA